MTGENKRTGRIYVLVGPSGVGKNSMMQAAIERVNNLRQLPTATTRPIREGEQEGREHFFVSREEFETLIENDALLEWQWVHGKQYGIVRKVVEDALEEQDDLIADIEVLGASILRRTYPENAVLVFVAPPDKATLEERIRTRGGVREEKVTERLRRTAFEMQFAPHCDYLILNDELEQATQELINIIHAERSRRNLRHLTASVLIYNEKGQVLAQANAEQQAPTLPHALIPPGESPLEVARRLIKEVGVGEVAFLCQPDTPSDDVCPVHFYVVGTASQPKLNLVFACKQMTSHHAPAIKPVWRWESVEQVPLAQDILQSQAVTHPDSAHSWRE